MIKSRQLNRVLIVSALVLTLSGIAVAAASGGDPLKMVPADAMFCIRINNLNGALGQTDMFLTGLIPMGVSMPVKSMLAQILGGAEPVGVDMAGSFVVFGPLPDGNDVDISKVGILVPVSDYSKFATGNPNVKPANAQGISKITAQQEESTASVIQVGSYALASLDGSDQALLAMKKTMTAATTGFSAGLDAAELKRAQNMPVWACLNVPPVAKKYGPMLKSALEGFKAMADAMQGQGNKGGQAQLQMAMDMYSSMLDSAMNETRLVTLTLDPNAAAIRAAVAVTAVPNTQMAEQFKGATAKLDPKLFGYLRDGSAMNFAFSLDPAKWSKLNATYADMMVKFMGKSLSPENVAALKKMMTDSTEALSGTFAGSFSINAKNKPPFEMRYVAALKDQAKLSQVLDEATKMMGPGGALGDMYKDMGMKMTLDLKRKAASYKGVDIDSMTFSMAMTDANTPEAKAVAAMYGSGMTVQMATTNGFMTYALTSDPNAIRELIDQVKAGGPGKTAAEAQNAMQLIPGADKGNMFATVNVTRLLQMASAMSGGAMPAPQTPVASQGNIALVGNCGDGKMTIEVALPKTHVMEIMGVVMQMQMQQMQQKQQAQPQRSSGGSRL